MSAYVIHDSATMLRRNYRHMVRYPSVSLLVIGIPVILLLLFVYVFGGTLGDGLGTAASGRDAYVDYVTPAIVLIAIAGAAQGTAISAAMDMHEGIIARFRTMGIARVSVLMGHVLGSTLQTMAGLVVVFGVAVLVGFRPHASVVEWVGGRRSVADDHPRDHVAVGGARARSQECGGGQQPADAADPAAVPQQRVRAGRVDARGPAVVRGVAAVHAVHRDAARAADGCGDRPERGAQRGVVRGDRHRRLPLGDELYERSPAAR